MAEHEWLEPLRALAVHYAWARDTCVALGVAYGRALERQRRRERRRAALRDAVRQALVDSFRARAAVALPFDDAVTLACQVLDALPARVRERHRGVAAAVTRDRVRAALREASNVDADDDAAAGGAVVRRDFFQVATALSDVVYTALRSGYEQSTAAATAAAVRPELTLDDARVRELDANALRGAVALTLCNVAVLCADSDAVDAQRDVGELLDAAATLDAGALQRVSLQRCRLRRAPRFLMRASALTKLTLSDNALLAELPAAVLPALQQLVSLSLPRNSALAALPAALGEHCTRLVSLFVFGCPQLAALPPSIGRCTRLLRLDVEQTRVYALPPSLQHCAHLHWLNLLVERERERDDSGDNDGEDSGCSCCDTRDSGDGCWATAHNADDVEWRTARRLVGMHVLPAVFASPTRSAIGAGGNAPYRPLAGGNDEADSEHADDNSHNHNDNNDDDDNNNSWSHVSLYAWRTHELRCAAAATVRNDCVDAARWRRRALLGTWRRVPSLAALAAAACAQPDATGAAAPLRPCSVCGAPLHSVHGWRRRDRFAVSLSAADDDDAHVLLCDRTLCVRCADRDDELFPPHQCARCGVRYYDVDAHRPHAARNTCVVPHTDADGERHERQATAERGVQRVAYRKRCCGARWWRFEADADAGAAASAAAEQMQRRARGDADSAPPPGCFVGASHDAAWADEARVCAMRAALAQS